MLLKSYKIDGCVIAYRKIPASPVLGRGKCNIDFAKDAFDRIIELGACCAVALDISSYFESIDHAHLRRVWCRVLGVSALPADHATVFKNITKYAVVDKEKLYERLGYFGECERGGRRIRGLLIPYKKIPKQLCSPEVFRERVAGGAPEFPSLIEKNQENFGIPQGAPISDVLANMYLIDFDVLMSEYAVSLSS